MGRFGRICLVGLVLAVLTSMTFAEPRVILVHGGLTIQAAIDASSDGDIVLLPTGAYSTGDIDFHGRAIIVTSMNPDDPDVVAATVIDCQGSEANPRRGFHFHNGEDPNSVLQGITIINGYMNGKGGGIYCSNSSPTIRNCVIRNCSASSGGGGMYNSYSSPTVSNCTFTNNTADYWGGGMLNDYSSPIVTTCTFSGNSADHLGGGMCNATGLLGPISSPTITGCTFSGNSAGHLGGGMFNESSNPIMTNCILWDNSASDFGNEIFNSSSTPVISYCDISGSSYGGMVWDDSLGTDGGGNIDADPMFVDAAGGDLHLQNTSPCINAGDNNADSLALTDFEGDPRIIHGIVDMGVDEVSGEVLFTVNVAVEPFSRVCTVTLDPAWEVYPPGTEVTITVDVEDDYAEGFVFDGWSGDLSGNENPATITVGPHKYVTAHFVFRGDIIYVDADAVGANIGMTWADAFNNLYDALSAAGSGNEIRVADGTYLPDTTMAGDPKTGAFALVNGVTVKGGYAGWGAADPNERNVELYETILSGDLLDNDDSVMLFEEDDPLAITYIDPNRIENCYHVFYHPESLGLNPNAILDGFTITGGNAIGTDLSQYSCGGGMYNDGSSPTVTNCIFSSNLASDGCGIYNDNSSPIVTNCIFRDNVGLAYYGYGFGGGMSNRNNSHPAVSNSIFSDNSAGSGGGICNSNSSPTVTNCIFSGNLASYYGGGIYNYSSSPVVSNCTFNSNSAGISNSDDPVGGLDGFSGFGGGVYSIESNPILSNCTFRGNMAGVCGGGMYNSRSSSSTVINSIFWGNTATFDGDEIALRDSSTIDADYCDVEGGAAGIYDDGSGNTINWGSDNIDVDPMFVDAEGGNLRLQLGSPCIDAGNDNVVTVATDMDGNPRVAGAAVDMGAYEFVPLPPPIETRVRVFPRVLNTTSRGRYVIARMELPDGVSVDDIESDSLTLEIGGVVIESVRQRAIGSRGRHYVFGFFDRGAVIAQVEVEPEGNGKGNGNGKLDIIIAGKLITGQCIYGEDTIKIVKSNGPKNMTLGRRPARGGRKGRVSR